jgi:hypothetical protein
MLHSSSAMEGCAQGAAEHRQPGVPFHAIHDADDPQGLRNRRARTVPDAKAVEAMMKYNQDLQKAGVLVALDGLHQPSMGARVSFSNRKPTVTDGPFAESKEVLGGYWMIRVNSRAEAIEWAKKCPGGDNEIIEIRQVQEMEDFPADVQKAAAGFAEMQPRQ